MDLDQYSIYQSDSVFESYGVAASEIQTLGALIKTITVQVEPMSEASKIRRSIVGVLPPSLVLQLEQMENIPPYVEERSYFFVNQMKEAAMLELCFAHDIKLVPITTDELLGLTEFLKVH